MVEETLSSHKEKWDHLAIENDRYYVRSVDHEQSDEEYEESGRKNYLSFIENDLQIHSRLFPFFEKNILEIGCGSGRITRTLARNFRNVAALDISRTMLEKARTFVASDNVIYLESNGSDVPLLPESVDLAFSFIVYQHFPTRESIETSFRGVNRALRKGGLFKVQVRGVPNPNPKHWSWGPHYSVEDAASLVDASRFRIISTSGEGTQYFWLLLEK